jgi:hypothetical protein
MEENLEQAAQAEKEAQADKGRADVYVHKFQTPFTLGSDDFRELTFDFGTLTGKDHNDSCKKALEHGWTTVVREFTPPYLTAMAECACTLRDEKGRRLLKYTDLERMNMKDLTKIQDAARRFLTRSES